MASIHANLLAVAEVLLDAKGVGDAGRRRAISTAYYAVFRRLASLSAAALAGSLRDEYEIVLRALNHRDVRKALKSREALLLLGANVGELYEGLLNAREWADYSASTHVDPSDANNRVALTYAEALDFVNDAREIIAALDALDANNRRKLAILLTFSKR